MDNPLWSTTQVLLLLSALAHIGLLVLVAARGRPSLANKLFCLFIFVLAAWILSVFATSLRLFIPYGSFVAYALAGIATPIYIAFLLAFAGKRLKPWYALFALPAAFNVVASLSGWVTTGPRDPNQLDQGASFSFLMPFFAVVTMGYLIIAVGFIIWTYWRTTDPFLRTQLRLPLAASILVAASGFTIHLLPPLLTGRQVGTFGLMHSILIVLPAAFSYSMLRYRYMEVAVALRIILVYVLTTVLLMSAIVLGLSLLGILPPRVSLSRIFFFSLATAILVYPLRRAGEYLVDRIFFKSRYHIQRDTRQVGIELARLPLTDLQDIELFLANKLKALLEVQSMELLIAQEGRFRRSPKNRVGPDLSRSEPEIRHLERLFGQNDVLVREEMKRANPDDFSQVSGVFDRLDAALLIPMVLRNTLIGIISVGEKGSRDLYSDKDVDFLTTIGGQVAVATGNAILYSEVMAHNQVLSEARESLREKEERFRSIVENSFDGIAIMDENHRVLYANEELSQITGYSNGELTDRDFLSLFDPETNPVIAKSIELTYEIDRSARRLEATLLHKNGGKRYVEINHTTIKDLRGRMQWIGHLSDITARKAAEDEKRSLEDQLNRALKMEAIGTLAAGVAHDLNNILSGIVGYPDLLLMDLPENSPLRGPIQIIQNSGEKAANIVQDLLTMARRGVSVAEVIDFNDIIRDYLKSPELQATLLHHPKAKIETVLDPELLNILGSPVHLTKSLMNLLSNAAEAMPEGGVIRISTGNIYLDRPLKGYDTISAGDYVLLSVSDEGIGMTPEEAERIFEPFYTKKVMGRSGTGLGMTVVWGTVKDHQGYILVSTAKGSGTAFHLYFPITRKGLPETAPSMQKEYGQGKGERILVVDDVEEQREIASGMLTRLGYSVHTVPSGEAAVEYLKGHSADLLLLDMIMEPGMDGLDTYKKILESHPGQKAIIASGYTETERINQARDLGAGDYIKKPYSLSKIGSAVRRELDKR
jgi:PAS domain S-box-containing protein